MVRREGSPKTLRNLLGLALEELSSPQALQQGQALALWPEIAGAQLSRLSKAQSLRSGTLWVKVTDSTLAHQLTYLREEFLRRYNERLPGAVREIRFSEGYQPPPPPDEPLDPLPLSPEEQRWLDELSQRAPQLAEVTRKAGAALLRRLKAASAPPCPICGVPSPEVPCRHCRGLLELKWVQKEAERLARNPVRHHLEGELGQAARYLALQKLRTDLEELLPSALNDPSLLPLLRDLAKRYLSLKGPDPLDPLPLPPALHSLLADL